MSRRPSPAVYRRRRIVVFGGLILLLAGIGVGVWLLFAQPWADAAEPEPGTTSGTTLPDQPKGGEVVSSEPVPCTDSEVLVEAVTDATEYRSSVNPKLSIRLSNIGAQDCTIDVGPDTQVFTIRSGNDIWWRSTDCQEDAEEMIVTLEAGREVTTAEPIEWNRTRSSASTCDSDARQKAPGGGASYHLSVEIGGFASQSTKQFFLY